MAHRNFQSSRHRTCPVCEKKHRRGEGQCDFQHRERKSSNVSSEDLAHNRKRREEVVDKSDQGSEKVEDKLDKKKEDKSGSDLREVEARDTGRRGKKFELSDRIRRAILLGSFYEGIEEGNSDTQHISVFNPQTGIRITIPTKLVRESSNEETDEAAC
jgi:phage protein D